MNAFMALHTDHNTGAEITLFKIAAKMSAPMHFLRDKMMESEANPALATCAGRD